MMLILVICSCLQFYFVEAQLPDRVWDPVAVGWGGPWAEWSAQAQASPWERWLDAWAGRSAAPNMLPLWPYAAARASPAIDAYKDFYKQLQSRRHLVGGASNQQQQQQQQPPPPPRGPLGRRIAAA